MDIAEFFDGHPLSRQIFDILQSIMDGKADVEMRVSRSQVSFRRSRAFAWVWIPGRALRRQAAPLVLTIALRRRHPSPRWKQVVEPYPGRFTHHLELQSPADLDDEVLSWVNEAWTLAGED